VVHGFRNGSDEEVTYLNFHAPGRGFADFMRALRDGRTLAYDQHDPPPDGGRSPSEAEIGGEADVEAIRISEERGDRPLERRGGEQLASFYVLEGELALTAGDGDVRAGAGSWVQVPPGVPHTLAFPAPARFLDIGTPPAAP
jgi:hypothetical protein